MKIEKIKKLPSGKYKIELNKDKLITYDDVILNNNILYSKEIDSELFNKLNIETMYYDIYNRVIKYITIKMRSEKEINLYLDKLNVDKTDKNKIIENLKKIGLINDLNFIKAFISDKTYLSNYGKNKIKSELLNHNIDETLIEEELSKYDDQIFILKAKKIIDKKLKTNKNSLYVFKGKIYNELLNLGYDKDMIISCLENINKSDDSLLEKDYNTIYKKLSKKYSNEELKLKIKSKLYQKGYDISDIDKIIRRVD